jgi:uncharacterized membrane protein YebE (DUF533 family)
MEIARTFTDPKTGKSTNRNQIASIDLNRGMSTATAIIGGAVGVVAGTYLGTKMGGKFKGEAAQAAVSTGLGTLGYDIGSHVGTSQDERFDERYTPRAGVGDRYEKMWITRRDRYGKTGRGKRSR